MLLGALALLVPCALLGAGSGAAAATNREPFAAQQWGLRQIGAEAAWDVTRGREARVGIIDTGVDLGHAELARRVVASTRCIGTGGDPRRCGGSAQDDAGHGTHVAGIVGAPLDGAGMAGVAPEAALLVVKALDANGSGSAADVAAGIDWLLGQGVHVVNLSLAETIPVRGSVLEAAIRRAFEVGAVVVLAAGNSGDADGKTPFNVPAIVVGATGPSGRLASYSGRLNSGIRWGMVAPGGDAVSGREGGIISTWWQAGRRNGYAWNEGTSMAAPHVAAAAALLASQGIRGEAAVARLLATAAPADCGTGCRGLLDARAAVGAPPPTAQAASNPPADPRPPALVEPPPATSTPVATTPPASTPVPTPTAVPTPTVATVGDPAPHAAAPAREELRAAAGPAPGGLLLVLAAAALLVVTAVTAVVSRARLRGDEGW